MNTPELLAALTEVKPGMLVSDVATAKRMNAISQLLRHVLRGGNIVTGPRIRKRSGDGWVTLVGEGEDGGFGGSSEFPFHLEIVPRPDNPSLFAVQITDGKVNNEWPDVGTDTMGSPTSPGFLSLDIANVENCNVFLRVMFNAKTNVIARLDIYERPNETFPVDQITFLPPDEEPDPTEADAADSPDVPPPAGYGVVHILLGYTFLIPPPLESPPGTPSTTAIFNMIRSNIQLDFIYGSKNGLPAVLAVNTYSKFIAFPLAAP
jgi:hypothetical protein